MKKRKIKLFASLTSLVMVVAVMAVGIWAATQANIGVTATAQYTAAANVKATIGFTTNTINATETGANDDNATAVVLTGSETNTEGKDYKEGIIEIGDVVLTNGALNENEGKSVFSYTITISNDAAETDYNNNLHIELTVPTEVTYAAGSYGVTVNDDAFTAGAADIAWDGADISYTVTFTVDANATVAKTAAEVLASSFVLTMTHIA